MASSLREVFIKHERPHDARVGFGPFQRHGMLTTRFGRIGLVLNPGQETADFTITLGNALRVIRDIDLDNEILLRDALESHGKKSTAAIDLSFSFIPSSSLHRLYIANLRLGFLVRNTDSVGVQVWSPEPVTAEQVSEKRNLKRIVERSLQLI